MLSPAPTAEGPTAFAFIYRFLTKLQIPEQTNFFSVLTPASAIVSVLSCSAGPWGS
jgi:hypothetical protein